MIKRKKHKKNPFKNEERLSFLKPKKSKSVFEKQVREQIMFQRFLDKNYYRVKKIDDLVEKFPDPEVQFRIITHQSFNAFAILLYILKYKKVKQLYFSTFSIDEGSVLGIEEIVKKENIENIVFVCNSLLGIDRPQRREKLVRLAKSNSNFKLIEAFNHTKIIAVETYCGNHYVIEGSGNLSANARIEQYLFENSKTSFQFHKMWIDEIKLISAKKDVTITK